jgi:type IV secretory pathway ATPase VirB11/archaellum biosynthesis ATPase
VSAAPDEIVDLTRQAFAELFTYGPLDALFADPNVTTITLEGIDKTAVRYGHGELVRLPPIFEDDHQLRRVIGRLLKDAGAEIRPDTPYIETGLTVEGRPVSVNLVLPPATLYITADIRVHPTALPTLDSLVDSEQARTLLRAIAQSPHGFVVVGESESGKTTLLSMLIALSGQQGIISVERAGELRLLDGAKQLKVQYAVGEPGQEGAQDAISFGGQIARALEESPGCIILDEVRSDEPEAILPLLMIEPPPRQCWAFRGQADSKRLSAALGMVARRGNPGNSEALVRALYARLPFIIAVRRRKERLQLHSISEWQYPPGAEYPDYMELMAQDWEGLALTGKRPARELALPDDFWG